MVDALHHRHAGRRQRHRGVVRVVEGDQDVGARRAGEAGQRQMQGLRADLGAAAAAAHRVGGVLRHRLHPAVHAHPAPVDAVLPAPDQGAFHGDPVAPGDGAAVAETEDHQRLRLRMPAPQWPAACGTPQVGGERRPGAHRPHSRLGPRRTRDAGAVSGGEHEAMAGAAQAAPDRDAAGGVAGEAGFGEEGGCHDAGGPQHLVGAQEGTVGERKGPAAERSGLHAARQLDPGFDQCRAGGGAGADGCRGKRLGLAAHQGEAEAPAEAVRQRQRQLRSRRPGAGDGERAPSASSASITASRSRKRPIGLTGTPPDPGMAGWPPISMDSRSNGMSGRPATATARFSRSSPVASAMMSRAPDAAASGARSICASSKPYSPRINPGSIPE